MIEDKVRMRNGKRQERKNSEIKEKVRLRKEKRKGGKGK